MWHLLWSTVEWFWSLFNFYIIKNFKVKVSLDKQCSIYASIIVFEVLLNG